MWIYKKKGQSTAEYVIVLGLVVAAVIAMQTYVKRGLQGRIRDATEYVEGEDILSSGTFVRPENITFEGAQYEPYYLSSGFDTTQGQSQTESLLDNGGVNRTNIQQGSQRSGTQTISEARD